jgi:hypothetical protein
MRAVFLYEQLVGKLDQRIERYEAAHNKFIQALNEA